MSTVQNTETTPYATNGVARDDEEYAYWRERSRLVISPVSAPSVLGLFGFAGATAIVSGNLAGWYGTKFDLVYYAPFAVMFGGIAQFLAGMWSYKARDTVATAMHGMWGSFWLAYGLLWLLAGAGVIPVPSGSTPVWNGFGMWFVMLSLITMFGAFAVMFKNLGMFATLGLLAGGSGLLAAAFLSGNHGVQIAGGWVLVASAGAAIYTAASLMLAEAYGRTILPLGSFRRPFGTNVPFAGKPARPIEYPMGMPGSRVGQ
jgi:succinate-acetate transporter protein